MNVILFLLLSLAIFYGIIDSQSMVKRSTGQYHRMIKKITGRKHSVFQSHGNYCPKGGYGKPIDELDQCCKEHGECINELRRPCGRNISRKRYIIRYLFKQRTYVCRNMRRSCRHRLCMCDLRGAECLKREMFRLNVRRP